MLSLLLTFGILCVVQCSVNESTLKTYHALWNPHMIMTHLYVLGPRQNGHHFPHEILKAFPDWKSMPFTEVRSNNCLPPTRRQAIIWTNDGWISDTNMYVTRYQWVDPVVPKQNCGRFADDFFICIDVKDNVCIYIKIYPVLCGQISNNSVLLLVMAWYQGGDKLLLEQMITQSIGAHVWIHQDRECTCLRFWQSSKH